MTARSETAAPLSQTPSSAPTRMDLPSHVARQIAEVAQQLPTRPVEISLSPEELGRVRLSVSATEAGLVVSVLAERAETLDLMRRHIHSLDQEFQALGYEDVSFSFSGQSRNAPTTQIDEAPSTSQTSDFSDPKPKTHPVPLTSAAQTGLDLRL
ncbi:MAG: flagellar hook-length control protein FliK [Sulfitobacter sp.]|nr:flagellar hook-length control protein FliK [Sulfitobacter sp.]